MKDAPVEPVLDGSIQLFSRFNVFWALTLRQVPEGADRLKLIEFSRREDRVTVNRLYAETVSAPYPNRAAIIVSGFAREEMLVEMVAYAALQETTGDEAC